METFKIFAAVFLAGIASLQMELSLLREATFILGTTAFTNSYIISIFLLGLAVGSYGGNLLIRLCHGKARMLFLLSQLVNIGLILFFLLTKNYILYGNLGDYAIFFILIYFGCMTVVPAIIAGMSFALFLNMLYALGEKYIALVYAISTAGNVFSGLNHGIFLIPYFGMTATYLVAIGSTGLAMLCIIRFQWLKFLVLLLLTGGSMLAAVQFKPMPGAIEESLLWSKDDIYGLVQVVDKSDLWIGWRGEKGIDLLIHNKHNCDNSVRGIKWHEDSARYSMTLLNDTAETVLILGYCSGATVAKFLDYKSISKVISIEMNKTVLEAAELFFPSIHEKVTKDKRSIVIIDEFKKYLRFRSKEEKFDIIVIDITIDDPYYLSMFTREFFVDIYNHLEKPGVLFFNSYQEFLPTGANVFDHLYCVKDSAYAQAFYFFTNFTLSREKRELFYEAFPLRQPGRIYTNNKVYRVSPPVQTPKEECLL